MAQEENSKTNPAYIEFDPETEVFCPGCRTVQGKYSNHLCPQEINYPAPIDTCPLCFTGIYEGSQHEPICEFRNKPTLRDQFAMAVLPAVMAMCIEAAKCSGNANDASPQQIAHSSYEFSDAMLEARKPKEAK